MIIKHDGKTPQIHPTAYVAPTATICGDVTIGKQVCVLFGASLIAEGGSIVIGDHCIVLEHAVVRSTDGHDTVIGDHVLVGPQAHVVGCTVEECVFLATGATVLYGAVVGARSEVRVNGVVHTQTMLPPDSTVPISWVAVGDPVELFSPRDHEKLWAVQKPLNFPGFVYGYERPSEGQTILPEITKWYYTKLRRHATDEVE
jgi:carbonic anhydrase/acetyltransferase-like protein (isoleucine patch superfamily)